MSKLDNIHQQFTGEGNCRNPECRKGYSPGIITAGKGTANAPVLGATMRWGWVKCRACNPDKDYPYTHVSRSPGEVAERARLADTKATYDPKATQARTGLERIKAATPAPAPTTSHDSDRVERLLDKIEKLTEQITTLMEENRELRAQQQNGSLPVPEKRRRTRTLVSSSRATSHEGDDDAPVSPKGKRSLS